MALMSNIKAEIHRLNGMIENFLTVGKPLALNKSDVDLVTLIREVVGLARQKAVEQGISIEVSEATPIPRLQADQVQIKTCLMNVVLNAIQAMRAGGMTAGHLLVVDDEKAQRDILTVILKGEGYTVEAASNVSQALSAYRNHQADVVLTDLSMPERDGLALLEELLKLDPEALVILVTAYGTIGSAVQAMKKGAFDYLAKPVDREELLITIARAFERLHLVTENRQLQQQLHETFRVENIIGHHPLMEEVSRVIKKVATSQATVLITGESGTGKELVARALHVHSPRAHRPFRALNCAAG